MTAVAATAAQLNARTDVPAIRPTLAEAAAIVAVRIGLWIGVQLLLAGGIVLAGSAGSEGPFNAAAGWWMVYGSVIDLATLALVLRLTRRHGISYRNLLGPPAAAWQIALGAVVVLAASLPAVVFSSELTSALYGAGGAPPMLSLVDVPVPAAIYTATIWPILAELAEPIAFLGIILPALERWSRRTWLAASLVVALWAVEHAFFPILLDGSGVDWLFAVYRVVSVVPFLAMWAVLYLVFGRRLLPIMIGRWIFNGGTAVAVGLGLV
jgi:hypothetical protein